MKLLRKFRFSMATAMVGVVTAAVASALFARLRDNLTTVPSTLPYLSVDVPAAFVLSIAVTAMSLGAFKAHSPKQVLLQMVLAYLSYFSVILLAEAGAYRPLFYWFQAGCLLLVALPLMARSSIKAEMERGPRRDWWKRTTEAVVFSFFTVVIVTLSSWLQWLTAVGAKMRNNLLNI